MHVTPAQAGVHYQTKLKGFMDSRLRGNDHVDTPIGAHLWGPTFGAPPALWGSQTLKVGSALWGSQTLKVRRKLIDLTGALKYRTAQPIETI